MEVDRRRWATPLGPAEATPGVPFRLLANDSIHNGADAALKLAKVLDEFELSSGHPHHQRL